MVCLLVTPFCDFRPLEHPKALVSKSDPLFLKQYTRDLCGKYSYLNKIL